jgi:hypothetical protein
MVAGQVCRLPPGFEVEDEDVAFQSAHGQKLAVRGDGQGVHARAIRKGEQFLALHIPSRDLALVSVGDDYRAPVRREDEGVDEGIGQVQGDRLFEAEAPSGVGHGRRWLSLGRVTLAKPLYAPSSMLYLLERRVGGGIMNPVDQWHYETLGKAACEALKRNGFDAHYVATGAEALARVAELIKPGMKIGFGGSMTLKGLGAQDKAKELGAHILDHNAPGLDPARKLEILRAQLTCDLFLSSSNAVTLEGDIVNADGNGNRVAALTFGPKKTVVVLGANKIVRDLDEALARLETWAAPMNNKRLDKPNPCVKAGTCQDCQGEARICRVYQILRRKPSLSDFTVIVVGESLGY